MPLHHTNGSGQASDMLAAALALARRGVKVFPCLPGRKEPATSRGLLDASSDAGTIEWPWSRDPTFNLAAACGPSSGFWVLDVDGEDGEDGLRELEAKHGQPLPRTVESITPRPGRHLLWAWPSRREVRNSAGQVATGIDVRGRGGYVVLPPSLHPSGRRYHWDIGSASAPVPAPEWLLDLICGPRGKTKTRFVAPAADWAAQLASGVSEPGRNDFVCRLSGYLLRHHLDPYMVRELMVLFGTHRCRPPLTTTETDKIVNSIAYREMKRRQGL